MSIYYTVVEHLRDNCIVFENFTASIGDLMVANWVYWRPWKLQHCPITNQEY